MARMLRPHVRQGIHGVLLSANVRLRLFPEAPDQMAFEAMLTRALQRNRARLHAYAWLEHQAKLVIQVDEVPIGRVVQQAVGPYSRYVNRRYGRRGHYFGRAYQSVLLNGTDHLPELVRHIHLMPVGPAVNSLDYPACSHGAYLGLVQVPWLTTELVSKLLSQRGYPGPDGYARFIAEGDDPSTVAGRAASGRASPFRRLDDESFCRWLKQSRTRRPSLEQIIKAACRQLHLEPEDLHAFKRPALPLARALITWHATAGAGIPLAEVAKCLNRHPSTLLASVRRHRALRPRLFQMSLEQLLAGVMQRQAGRWALPTDRKSKRPA